MAPSINISEATFERLQRHAVPLIDSFDTLINRLLDTAEAGLPNRGPTSHRNPDGARRFSPTKPPQLTHTKVVSATFNGKILRPANWNRLLDAAVVHATKSKTDFSSLRRLVPVNVVKGKKEDEGYHYLALVDISVQGQDANAAWRYAVLVAQAFGCAIEVSFVWRNKDGAEYPGQAGMMVFEPQ